MIMKSLKVSEIINRFRKNTINANRLLDNYIGSMIDEGLIISQSDILLILEKLKIILDDKNVNEVEN